MPSHLKDEVETLSFIQERLQDPDLPALVQKNVRRHHENLSRLAQNLRNLGLDHEQIDEHVIEIFKEYERELAANIGRIKAASHGRRLDEAG
jgi:hypothetical protein